LEQVNGYTAQVWSYTVSHAKLTIRFVTLDGGKNAYVVFRACEQISLPTGWLNAKLRVEVERLTKANDPVKRSNETDRFRLRVTDEAANVVVCCGGADAYDDVPPEF
jgi:hypothetical protein